MIRMFNNLPINLAISAFLSVLSSVVVVVVSSTFIDTNWLSSDRNIKHHIAIPDRHIGGPQYECRTTSMYIIGWHNTRERPVTCDLGGGYSRYLWERSQPDYYTNWAARNTILNRIWTKSEIKDWIYVPPPTSSSCDGITYEYGWPFRMESRSVQDFEYWGGGIPTHHNVKVVSIPTTGGPRKVFIPTAIIPGGAAANFASHAAIWFAILGAPPRLVRWAGRRRSRGLCPKCAYDLRHDFPSGCPECGWGRVDDQRDPV